MDDSSIINAFKHMKLPLMIVGSDGTIVHCNSGTDRLFGYDHGELIGRPAFVVLPVSSVKELNAFIKAPATDATIKNMVGRKQSGNSVRLAIHLTAWTEAKIGLQHALVLRDVTDDIEIDLSLKEKLKLANRAIATTGVGVFKYSIPQNLVNGSAAWRALMDLDEDEKIDTQKAWYERVHPDDKEEMAAKIVACTEDISMSGCVYEFRLRSKIGSTWNWRRTDLAVTNRDEEGKAISFLGATVDITEQKEAARILRMKAEQFKSIFENSPVAKAMANADHIIIRVNRAFCALFDYSEDTILGTKLNDHSLAEDRHVGVTELDNLQSGKISTYEVEKRYIRANGAVMWALLSVGIADKVDDLPNHFILQITDITERQRMDEFRGKFVSTVSHELRTPLTSVLGALSLLSSMESEPLSREAQRLLYIAQENGNRLHALVDDILDFEKSSANQMRFTLSRQQIIVLVEDAIFANMVFAEEFGVRFQLKCTDRSLTASVDPMRFQQVIGNLLTNATKFADKGSTVDVLVESEIGAVRVSISNDGEGIPDGFHSEIFKPFAQAVNRRTDARSGSGLGLNITKQILDQTGGTIGYDSAKDGRTTFWFTVPVKYPD